jgi:heme exporter protein C
MLICIILPIVLAFKHGITLPRKKYWIITTFILVTSVLIFTILPPISGNFSDARRLSKTVDFKDVDVSFVVSEIVFDKDEVIITAIPSEIFHFTESKNFKKNKYTIISTRNNDLSNIEVGDKVVSTLNYLEDNNNYQLKNIIAINPLLEYPFIEALQHRIKNLNLHVPLHWTSFIAYLISLIYSIKYLKRDRLEDDVVASSAIKVGLIFTILGTVTGMVWAKFNWGAYWNWDPRQTTILVIMLIYFAYFGLRNSLDSFEKKAKLSAVYSIISFIAVPVLMFIIPRLLPSLHPGGKDDGTTGPVLSTQADMVDSSLAFIFYLSIAAFLFIYFWYLSIEIRQKMLENKLREQNV